MMNRRWFLGKLGLAALFAAAPVIANSATMPRASVKWFPMRKGTWIYRDTGKPAELWNVWDRSDAEQLAAHDRAWEEVPSGFSRGGVDADAIEQKLAEEEDRFAADKERFRREAGGA